MTKLTSLMAVLGMVCFAGCAPEATTPAPAPTHEEGAEHAEGEHAEEGAAATEAPAETPAEAPAAAPEAGSTAE